MPEDTAPDTTPDTAAAIDADGDGFSEDEDCNDSDSSVFPGAEEVYNGIDDDCDGLLDCEDGELLSDASCVEDCEDGVDNDIDGAADCADEDCWLTTACTITTLGVDSGTLAILRIQQEWMTRSLRLDATSTATSVQVRGVDVAGWIRHTSAGGAVSSCTWSTPSSSWGHWQRSAYLRPKYDLTGSSHSHAFHTAVRSGPILSSACAIPEGFVRLPDWQWLDPDGDRVEIGRLSNVALNTSFGWTSQGGTTWVTWRGPDWMAGVRAGTVSTAWTTSQRSTTTISSDSEVTRHQHTSWSVSLGPTDGSWVLP